MGQFGKLASVHDLPPKRELVALIRSAAKLDRVTSAPPQARGRISKELRQEIAAKLANDATARARFEALSPRHRREYLDWIVSAKRSDTRERRIRKMVDALARTDE